LKTLAAKLTRDLETTLAAEVNKVEGQWLEGQLNIARNK
jgi:hypothetical protein